MKTRSLLVGIMTSVLTVATLATPAHAATFTWSSQPLLNLKAEGALINGGITNFPTKSGLYVQQCEAPAVVGERPTNCLDLAWISNSGTRGTISPKGAISFTLKANFNGKLGPVDCFKSECGLFFSLDHLALTDKSEDTYIKISFANATSTPTLLLPDSLTVTLNGKPLVKNVAVNLGYRASAKIIATSTSGLPVEVVSATTDCSYSNGVLIALKGSGVCAIDVSTEGDSKFEPARANFPFNLVPGEQKIAVKALTVTKGKIKILPLETNFGQAISYSSNSKNCRVELNVLEVKGGCVITAKAAAKAGMWNAMKSTIKVKAK